MVNFPNNLRIANIVDCDAMKCIYVGVASENLTFVPDCWTIAEYMGGSFDDYPT